MQTQRNRMASHIRIKKKNHILRKRMKRREAALLEAILILEMLRDKNPLYRSNFFPYKDIFP